MKQYTHTVQLHFVRASLVNIHSKKVCEYRLHFRCIVILDFVTVHFEANTYALLSLYLCKLGYVVVRFCLYIRKITKSTVWIYTTFSQ